MKKKQAETTEQMGEGETWDRYAGRKVWRGDARGGRVEGQERAVGRRCVGGSNGTRDKGEGGTAGVRCK